MIAWPSTGAVNQRWQFRFGDSNACRIHSELNDFALTLQDGQLVMQPAEEGNLNQIWLVDCYGRYKLRGSNTVLTVGDRYFKGRTVEMRA